MSGIGGALRDSNAVFIRIFSMSTGLLWAYEVEVKAIFTTLKFCKEHS